MAKKRYVNYQAWKGADNKAQKLIVMSLNEQPLQYILNCETASSMWDKLLSVYKCDNNATKVLSVHNGSKQ